MNSLRKENKLAFYCLVLLLPVNGVLSIFNAHHTVPFYSISRSLVLAPFSILLVTMFITILLKPVSHTKRYYRVLLIFSFMITLLFFVTLNNIEYELIDKYGRNAVTENLEIFSKYIIYFVIGLFLVVDERFKNITIFFLLLMIFSVFAKMDMSNLSLNLGSDYSKRINYLFLGDVFAMWSILAISYMNRSYSVYILMLVTLIVSYLIGSRTSFFLLIIAYALISYVYTKNKYLLISICFFVSLLFLLSLDPEVLSDNRMLSVILLEDTSLDNRAKIMKTGLVDIKNNWFYGKFAAPLLEYNTLGMYIHNHLSLWRQFGLIPFSLSLVLFYMLFKRSIIKVFTYKRKQVTRQQVFFTSLSFFLLLEILFARSYAYPYVWACVGMLAAQGKQTHLYKVKC